MPEYDEETQAKITGTVYLLIIDELWSWGVILTIVLIFATAADQARKEFNDAESATQDTEKEIRSVYPFKRMRFMWYDPKIGCVRRQAINFFNRVILYNIDKKER